MRVLLFIILLSPIFTLEIFLSLEKGGSRCIGDSYSANTLIKGQIRGSDVKMKVDIYDGTGNKLYSKMGESVYVFSFTTKDSAIHQFCINNYGEEDLKFAFSILHGLQAKDESMILDKDKLKPIDNYVKMLKLKMGELKRNQLELSKHESKRINEAESVNSQIFYSSIFTIFLVGLLIIVQRKFVHGFFKRKKMI